MSTSVAAWQRCWRAEQLQPTMTTKAGRAVSAAAVKVTLLALSTWADYDTGRDARPGVPNLVTATGLGEQRVRWALQAGRELGWIERTSHRPGTGRADVYGLVVPEAAVRDARPFARTDEEPATNVRDARGLRASDTETPVRDTAYTIPRPSPDHPEVHRDPSGAADADEVNGWPAHVIANAARSKGMPLDDVRRAAADHRAPERPTSRELRRYLAARAG